MIFAVAGGFAGSGSVVSKVNNGTIFGIGTRNSVNFEFVGAIARTHHRAIDLTEAVISFGFGSGVDDVKGCERSSTWLFDKTGNARGTSLAVQGSITEAEIGETSRRKGLLDADGEVVS